MELIKYISLSVLVICATACSKSIDVDEHVESKVPDSSQISMMVDSESFTRAIPDNFEVENEAAMGTVGFYCAYTEGDNWVDSEKDFTTRYNNTLFEYNKTLSEWTTNGAVAWDFSSITDKYTFYAYSPYSAGSTKGIKPSIDSAGDLNITDYTIPTDEAKMVDLLVATPRVDIHPQSGGKVNMTFNHALSRVKFLAKVDAATNYITPSNEQMTEPSNNKAQTTTQTYGDPYVYSAKVKSITWKSLANTGTLKMSANSASIAWTDHSTNDDDRTIDVTPNVELRIASGTPTAQTITDEYLLLPQICNTDDDEIMVELDITTHHQQWSQKWKKNKVPVDDPVKKDPIVTTAVKTKPIKLSQSSMSKIEMGKVYELTIVVPTAADAYDDETFDIEVRVLEWSDATVNIPDFN